MEPNTNEFVKAVIAASWQGGLVILLILLVRPVLGVWVPARWRYALGALALIRLLVPAFMLPPSPASLQNVAVMDRPFEQAALALDRRAAGAPMPMQMRQQGPAADESPSVPPPAAIGKPQGRAWWRLASAVWLLGAAASVMLIAVATIRLHRRVRRDSAPADESIEHVWLRCCARLPISRPPRLLATGCVDSPALIGLLHPALLIPKDAQLSAEDWEHVFMHELAHFRRRDHWTQMVQLLALCAHWFNPLVWIGFRYLRADRELAADEWALRHLDGARSVAYGDTLLKVLAGQAGHAMPRCAVGIMEDAAQMKQRLRHIVSFAPRRLVGSIAGIAVVLALAAAVLGRQATDLAAYEGLAPAESLVIAARRGDRAAVEQLLSDGVDVNGITNLRGERTALTAAIAGHAEEVIRLLVTKGADVNAKPDKAEAPIILALRKGDLANAEYLRGRGATCDAETWAAAIDDTAAVKAYLAGSAPGYDKVKLLGEVAAAHGHRALFALLYDTVKQLPEQRDYFPFSRGTFVVAVTHDHRGVIEEILSRDPNLVPGDGVNRLAAAALQTPGMREWLNEKGIKVPEYTDGERLIDAAEREDLSEIRRLLKAGVDVNSRGESEWTPIAKAATWGCPRAVKLLLENGADANIRKHSYTPLALAKTPEIADLLFAAGADINFKLYERDVHIISYCVGHGSKEMVQWFLDHGVDPAKVKGDEPTLLFNAGSPEIVDLLVARGVDVHARDDEGRTAVHWQLQLHQSPAKVVAALLKHGADPNARMKGGYTPLMQSQDGASVDVLVAAGADLQGKDDRGNGVLMTGWGAAIPSRIEALRRHGLTLDLAKGGALLTNAILLRHDLSAVKTLLALGVDPNSQDSWEGRSTGTGLSAAISNGHFKIADVLRAAGANDVGRLSEAAAKGELVQMTALLEAGASVDELSSNGETPLHYAVQQGQVEAVKLLLARGASVNRFTATGYTALALARVALGPIEHGNFSPIDRLKPPEAKKALDEIIAAIRERRPDPNFRNEAGETALMCGAGVGSISVDLREGVDLDAQRPDGMTALMLAIASQSKDAPREGPGSVGIGEDGSKNVQRYSSRAYLARILIENGADVTLRNQAGQTALDLARATGNPEILEILQKTKPTETAKAQRCLAKAKIIALGCKLYADDHDGEFPTKPEQLLPDYLADPDAFTSPLATQPGEIGYELSGGRDSDEPSKVLVRGRFTTSDGRRSVVYLNRWGALEWR
jgi:bla regulator protein BlaR1